MIRHIPVRGNYFIALRGEEVWHFERIERKKKAMIKRITEIGELQWKRMSE